MKLSLKKNHVNRLRLVGLKQTHQNLDQVGSSVAKLYDLILTLNFLQLTEKRVYFQINNQSEFTGPFVSVLGNVNSDADYLVTDLVEMDHFHLVLSENDALSLSRDSFYQQLFSTLRTLEEKISFNFTYLSIELAKIELHLFVK